jgi:hypothetical protein
VQAAIGIHVHRVRGRGEPGAVGPEWIGAEPDQQVDHRRPIHLHREVQRQAVVLELAHRLFEGRLILADNSPNLLGEVHGNGGEDVVPGAAFDQQLHDGALRLRVGALPARRPPDCLQLMIVAVANRVDAGVEQPAHHLDVSRRGGPVERGGVIALLEGVHVEAAVEQQVDDGQVAALGGVMQQGPRMRLIADEELAGVQIKRCGNYGGVPAPGSFEQLLSQIGTSAGRLVFNF